MERLNGKTVFVTGGTKGLGSELAIAMARAGAAVALIGRDLEGGRAVAAQIEALGGRALPIVADVTDEASVQAAAQQALAHFGSIDLLLCVAGVGSPRRPIWESTADDFHACFNVNVLGVLIAMQAVLPAMLEQRSGRVVVIGGTYGHKGVANAAIYASSKWALRGLVKSAALEVGGNNITVNLVSPGGIEGERLERMFRQSAEREGISYEEVLSRFTSKSAMNRLVDGEDIAQAVLQLACESGRMVTGQDIVVDAGMIV